MPVETQHEGESFKEMPTRQEKTNCKTKLKWRTEPHVAEVAEQDFFFFSADDEVDSDE